jgi:hypothetical protein
LIGNGDGCIDGEIQIGQRWAQQRPATPPPGVTHFEDSCISIAIVGHFDQALPTPTQLRRLSQLVTTLQSRLSIPSSRVVMIDQSSGPAGVGARFPTGQFRAQLLP